MNLRIIDYILFALILIISIIVVTLYIKSFGFSSGDIIYFCSILITVITAFGIIYGLQLNKQQLRFTNEQLILNEKQLDITNEQLKIHLRKYKDELGEYKIEMEYRTKIDSLNLDYVSSSLLFQHEIKDFREEYLTSLTIIFNKSYIKKELANHNLRFEDLFETIKNSDETHNQKLFSLIDDMNQFYYSIEVLMTILTQYYQRAFSVIKLIITDDDINDVRTKYLIKEIIDNKIMGLLSFHKNHPTFRKMNANILIDNLSYEDNYEKIAFSKCNYYDILKESLPTYDDIINHMGDYSYLLDEIESFKSKINWSKFG